MMRRLGLSALLMLCAMVSTGPMAASAQGPQLPLTTQELTTQEEPPIGTGFDLRNFFGGFLSMDLEGIPIDQEEIKGLFCLTGGVAAGGATALFSGTAAAVTGAVQATLVAMPALAAAMWAGCAFGAAAAPGIVWIVNHGRPF